MGDTKITLTEQVPWTIHDHANAAKSEHEPADASPNFNIVAEQSRPLSQTHLVVRFRLPSNASPGDKFTVTLPGYVRWPPFEHEVSDHSDGGTKCYLVEVLLAQIQTDEEPPPSRAATTEQPPPSRKSSRKCQNDKCLTNKSAGMRCAACRDAWYCSAACQKQDWKADHKAVCSAAKQKAKQPKPSMMDCPKQTGLSLDALLEMAKVP